MLAHPTEWCAAADAIIERGRLEKKLGVYTRWGWGTASQVYGMDVRAWPRDITEDLAYAEDKVLTTQVALRRLTTL